MVFCNTFKHTDKILADSHNPYFNRWFSAIQFKKELKTDEIKSQSLF